MGANLLPAALSSYREFEGTHKLACSIAESSVLQLLSGRHGTTVDLTFERGYGNGQLLPPTSSASMRLCHPSFHRITPAWCRNRMLKSALDEPQSLQFA